MQNTNYLTIEANEVGKQYSNVKAEIIGKHILQTNVNRLESHRQNMMDYLYV